jgi:DNA-binding beta-propeller fold protein YncE
MSNQGEASMKRSSARLVPAILLFSLAAVALGAEPPPVLVLQWGSHGTGDGQFNYPDGVATDASGNVYVASGNDRIQKFDGAGNFLTKWSSTAAGGVATDGAGHVYVTDVYNHRIRKFDSSGVLLAEWGSLGAGDGQFSAPRGVAVDASGNVYVTDHGNSRVQKFDSGGTFLTKWGSNGAGDGQFSYPRGIAVDATGNVFVADADNHRIQKFDSDGTYLGQWGCFWYPLGIAVDADRNKVYVGDTAHRIQKFEPPLPLFAAPVSPENGSTFDWPAGKLLDLDIKVVDGTSDDTVTLEAVELPEGAELTLASPDPANPALAGFAWTPTEDDAGEHVITLRATDGDAHEVDFTFTVDVKGDSDGDGLSDLWETEGYTAPNGEYVPLHQMGADPYHKDVFVDVDYMRGEATNLIGTPLIFDHRPICAAMDEIKAAFAAAPVSNPDGTTGITLHVRVAQQADCSSSEITPRADFVAVLGSRDAAQNYLWTAPPGSSVIHFDDLKDAQGIFPAELGYAVHYCVFAHTIAGSQTGMSRGLDAGDFIVSLGSLMAVESIGLDEGTTVTANPEAQAGTFMHELGHNLNLGHGGVDDVRQKPNYLSIMNKDFFQMQGLIIDGERGAIGGNHGSEGSRHYHFDYSREALPGWAGHVLAESALDESVGLEGSAAMSRYGTFYYSSGSKHQVNDVNDPIEWDFVHDPAAPFAMDVSNLNSFNKLLGYDDWSNLSYTGGRVGGGIVIPLPEVTPADELSPEEAVEQVHAVVAVTRLRGHVADKMLHLTWKPIGTGFRYDVYRRENTGDEVLVGTTTTTEYKDTEVVAGVTYTYTVRAVDPVHETESAPAEAVSLQLRE